MNILHKKPIYFIIYSIIISVMLFGSIMPVNAQHGETALQNPVKYKTIEKFVDAISDIVVKIGGVLAIIFIIWSGFLFVSSRGNEEQLKKAKSVFMWTIIGTAVLLGASVIAKAVVNFVQGLE